MKELPPCDATYGDWEKSFFLSLNFYMFTSYNQKRALVIPPGKESLILIKHGEFVIDGLNGTTLYPGFYFITPSAKSNRLISKSSAELLRIDLNPTSLYRLSGRSMHVYSGRFHSLQEILPINLTQTALSFNFLNKETLLNWFQYYFLDKLKLHRIPDCIMNSIQLYSHFNQNLNITELCCDLNVNRRSYERKFRQVIGISPKNYWKMHRVNFAADLLKRERYSKLQDVVYQCGYFDQSHFIRDFKELMGSTPSEYLVSN